MAILNAWQKLTRVLPGKPFGNGADGAYSSATIPTLTKDSCSGSATSTTLTTTGSTFANGDILMIHQSRGTGVGQWEVNRVVSGGGSTSLTLQVALNYTYTDSGASQAQAVKILQYSNVTVETGTWTVPSWNENIGGIFPMAVKGDLTVTGTISANGVGFIGGTDSRTGEGTVGASVLNQQGTNGNGGGGGNGGDGNQAGAGGGGGGNASTASAGENVGGSTGGAGGLAVGSADLTTMDLGGAGGGGKNTTGGGNGGDGGNGAGIIIIFAKNITSINSIVINGNNGIDGTNGDAAAGSGGGGGGGSCLIVCQTATLGTNKISVAAGTGATANANGGNGSAGRIAVHHSRTVTGTTSPSFTDVEDTTLKESTSGMFLVF